MAFKITPASTPCPDDPEALLRDIRRKTIPGLLSHQADLIRSYVSGHRDDPDVAIQLPTGSGKTLIGLVIGEWCRRKLGDRVVYLCPTNQLVNQVVDHATNRYGIDVRGFTGSIKGYLPSAKAEWQNAEALGVTNYSSVFNTNPFFVNPTLVILDDAHSAENYIASYWSLHITRAEHEVVFAAIAGLICKELQEGDRGRLLGQPSSGDRRWVEILPAPALLRVSAELTALLDGHVAGTSLEYGWRVVRDALHACTLYLSSASILLRPMIPPTNTHSPFSGARQRLYMSATLGEGGDLERTTGRFPITRLAVPAGWDKQGIGRRFFLFPGRSLSEADSRTVVEKAAKLAGRSMYLVPDSKAANDVADAIATRVGIPVFRSYELEESKIPFVSSAEAMAVVANRYDGIDLAGDECRMLFVDGLPEGINLQERFFVARVTARLLLDDRILTRLIQGFGRCTRSPNDYAAVMVLGEGVTSYLLSRERRAFMHPELQAEIEFGIQQSRESSIDELVAQLEHCLGQDAEWDKAEAGIVALREGLRQNKLAATAELASAVESELAYQYALWNADFQAALEHARTVIGRLTDDGLRGYRALWLYLAGSAAWLSHSAGSLPSNDIAIEYFRKAQAAAPVLKWLIGLQSQHAIGPAIAEVAPGTVAVVERMEAELERLGTVHDRRFDTEESFILAALLQDSDGVLFEQGHERLGRLLGYDAGNSSDEAAPDPWWIVDDDLCLVFEDHAEALSTTVLSAQKARQVACHPDWIRANVALNVGATIVPILVTPCVLMSQGAAPSLERVRYWRLDHFREWAKKALRAVRDLRRSFVGTSNIAWRLSAAARLKADRLSPEAILADLGTSAAASLHLAGDGNRE